MFKAVLFFILFSSISLAVSPVLKTGQTKSYDADGNVITDKSIKDDGYYQRGKARSYSRSSVGVVTDNVIGLQWQDNESVQRPWLIQENYEKCRGLNGQTKDTSKCTDTSGDTAVTYCSNLLLDGGGWRLPTIEELETLVDDGHQDPSTTPGIFQHIISYSYWSSSTPTYPDNNGNAWVVYFGVGNTYTYYKNYPDFYVRCVRGGRS